MISYRFRRRAFLGALGGGVGLKVMLRNAELTAQTAQSPPRFLVTYWPLAIVPGSAGALWTPTKGAAGGHALQTFADNGLADDMISLRGITTGSLSLNGGGAREGGSVVFFTGVATGGTRANRGEPDDAFAAGPSIDQVLLRHAPALRHPLGGPGSVNSIGDQRTDLGEVSAKCLSYSYEQQPVTQYSGEVATENKPLMATLSPLAQYLALFAGVAPGGGAMATAAAGPASDEMLKQLAMRRSVLDFGLSELNRMKTFVPGAARQKLQIHFDAVQKMEAGLTDAINWKYPAVTGTGGNGGGAGAGVATGGAGGHSAGTGGAAGGGGAVGGRTCPVIPGPPPDVQGVPDWAFGGHGNYGSPKNGSTDDIATHQLVGQLHMDVFRAAFVCDLIRCGTFQWAPATSHVGFKGLYPGDEAGIYSHHAVTGSVPAGGNPNQGTTPDEITNPAVRFLFNVERWYFARQAENVKRWKDAVDGFGNPLLESTIIPFVTETDHYNDSRSNIPAMIFGGKKLGLQVGQYKSGSFSVNSFWGTIAQALGCPADLSPLAAPIPGLWSAPAK